MNGLIYTIHLTVMLNSELREFCVMKENHVSSLTSDIDINLALPESLKILNWKTQKLDNKNTMLIHNSNNDMIIMGSRWRSG